MTTLSTIEPDLFQAFLDDLPVPLGWFRVGSGTCVMLNRLFRETYSVQASEITSWDQWSRYFLGPEEPGRVLAAWRGDDARLRQPDGSRLRVREMELCMQGRDGSERTVLHSGVILPALDSALVICLDVTARKKYEKRLAEAEQAAREHEILYPLLLELTSEMIVLTNADGARQFVSPAVLPLTGWTPEEYLAMRMESVVHPDDVLRVANVRTRCLAGATGERVQYRTLKKDGSYLWVEATASCYQDPAQSTTLGYVATIRDGSAQQAEEARRLEREAILEQQARFDQLTGVANRHVFYSALSDEARRQTRRTQELALLLIDVDYFKLFNDRYGHLEGDRVLRRVAGILQESASRVADLLARFGGEEFVLLLPMTDAAGAETIGRRVVESISNAAIPHMDSAFGHVTVSVGIATWPGSAPLERDELLLLADKALYAAKKAGRNTVAIRHCGILASPLLVSPAQAMAAAAPA